MDEILTSVGLSSLAAKFKENKVLPGDVLNLRDTEFDRLGVTFFGDRARLRAKCREQVEEGLLSSPVVQRVRDRRKCRKRRNVAFTVATDEKATFRVYVGWKHRSSASSSFKLIGVNYGGGKQEVDIATNSTLEQVLQTLTDTYFPDGRNEAQKIDLNQVSKEVTTFSGSLIPQSLQEGAPFTLGGYVKQKATHPIRLYLQTTTISVSENGTSDQSDDNDIVVLHDSSNYSGTPTVVFNRHAVSNRRSNLERTVTLAEDNTLPDLDNVSAPFGMNSEGGHLDPTLHHNGDAVLVSNSAPEMPTSESPDIPVIHPRRQRLRCQRAHRGTSTSTTIDFECTQSTATVMESWNQTPEDFEPIQSTSIQSEPTLAPGNTIEEILQNMEEKVNLEGKNVVNVYRADILNGGFRAFSRTSFDPWKKLEVKFVDEDAIDGGGPMREFMRLSTIAIHNLPIFAGEEKKMMVLDYNSIEKKTYFKVGQMLSYFLVHRGPQPSFFSPLLFSLIVDEKVVPTEDDIMNNELKVQVKEITAAKTDSEFQDAVQKAQDAIVMAGCHNLSWKFDLKDKLVKGLCNFMVLNRVREPLEQFKKGLQTLGILESVKSNPSLWKDVFVGSKRVLDPTQVQLLFETKWSTEGSNKRAQERRIASYWLDFVQDLADGITGPITGKTISLPDLLVFVTGADCIPPLGLDPAPTLSFIHPEEDVESIHMMGMPTSNTCGMELRLPMVEDFDTFKSNMAAAIEMVSTFTSI